MFSLVLAFSSVAGRQSLARSPPATDENARGPLGVQNVSIGSEGAPGTTRYYFSITDKSGLFPKPSQTEFLVTSARHAGTPANNSCRRKCPAAKTSPRGDSSSRLMYNTGRGSSRVFMNSAGVILM